MKRNKTKKISKERVPQVERYYDEPFTLKQFVTGMHAFTKGLLNFCGYLWLLTFGVAVGCGMQKLEGACTCSYNLGILALSTSANCSAARQCVYWARWAFIWPFVLIIIYLISLGLDRWLLGLSEKELK